jgi:hypothetical protein
MKSSTIFAAFLSLSALAAGAARAETEDSAPFAGKPPEPAAFSPATRPGGGLGTVGEWVASFQSSNSGSPDFQLRIHSGGGWNLHLRPALDTFLLSNFSVGGVVGFGYGSGNSTFEIGARAGYVLPIVNQVAFWPTGGIYFSYTTGNHMSQNHTYLGIFAPFLYVPTPHFFVGLGPTFNQGLSGGNGQDYGLDFTLGGWI